MEVLKFKSFDDESQVFTSENIKHNSSYLQDYLKSTVNRLVKVDFLLDSNFISKEGILKEVGNDYIILEMLQTNDLLACDIYSIKFVQII
ncbi:MAG: hypothetical protein PHT02_03585 [Tissierellia bacterium]|nr:hypothetical protein [Tissierellia bacterium]